MFNFCHYSLPNEICITLEIAKDMNTVILPSEVNCIMRHNFKMFPILTIRSEKFFILLRIFIKRKMIPKYVSVNYYFTCFDSSSVSPFSKR